MQIQQPVQSANTGFIAKLTQRLGKLGGKLGLAIFDQRVICRQQLSCQRAF